MNGNIKSDSKKILVAISGGRNSAVAAAILKSQGHSLHAVHLQVFDPKQPANHRFGSRCCGVKSVEAATEVCRKLDIPLQVMRVDDRFEDRVVDTFLHGVLQSRRVNPCIPCNQEVRFEALFRKADELGIETVATGHHAQVFQDAVTPGAQPNARLLRAVNEAEDQSFVLFGLKQEQLLRLMMPVGGFQRVMIERLAREFELPQAEPGNKQAACFLGSEASLAFIESHSPESLRPRGIIKLVDGTAVGEHLGLYRYQLGNEAKLNPQIKEKYVVVGFDVPAYGLIVGKPGQLTYTEVLAGGVQWVRPMDGVRQISCRARLRSDQRDSVACRVSQFENGMLQVDFEQPQQMLAQGQALVFYEGEEVLGGAFVEFLKGFPREE